MNYMDVMVNKYGKELAMELIEELLDWRDIENYEGLYRVSEWGDVMSLQGGKKKLLKQNKDRYGYPQVNLSKNSEVRTCKVHRLVATAFCEGAGEFPEVNHKDEDKTNNHYDNLEWCTGEYNLRYGTKNKRTAEKLSKKVRCVELDMVFDSEKEAKAYTGAQQISRCCKGIEHYITSGGYHWEYIEE